MVGKPAHDAPASAWSQYSKQFSLRVAALGSLLQHASAVEIWNEEDLAPQPGYDVFVPAVYYGPLLKSAHAAVKSVAPSLTVVLGGIASGNPGYLRCCPVLLFVVFLYFGALRLCCCVA
jgi:hypothetical protein